MFKSFEKMRHTSSTAAEPTRHINSTMHTTQKKNNSILMSGERASSAIFRTLKNTNRRDDRLNTVTDNVDLSSISND